MPRARSPRTEILPGTLEMLILQTLSVQPMHGYAIAQHIQRLSNEVLRVEQGSLYPALERLLGKGLVTARWTETPTRRRGRYYAITAAGRKRLGEKISTFDAVLEAIQRVLERA